MVELADLLDAAVVARWMSASRHATLRSMVADEDAEAMGIPEGHPDRESMRRIDSSLAKKPDEDSIARVEAFLAELVDEKP